MCEPVSLSTLAMAATVASGTLAAYSAVRAGNAQKAAAEYNAALGRNEADRMETEYRTAEENTALERRRLAERVRAERGDTVARSAAMGIDPAFGSSADLIGDIETAGRTDSSILSRNLDTARKDIDNRQTSLRNEANFTIAEGREAQRSGYLQAGGSLLSTASTVGQRWSQLRTPEPPFRSAPMRRPEPIRPVRIEPLTLPIG
jgi:hypothetical protein